MPLTPGEESGHWPELHRERRALVVVDVVESVRLMQQHEDEFIERWRRFIHETRASVLPEHGGRMVKSLGDGMLLTFGEVPRAVAAARAMQRRICSYNAGGTSAAAIQLRMGVHTADVVVDELDVFGAGVNLAARLATLAQPGQIVASAEVRDLLVLGLDAEIEDLGDCYFKHLAEPVRSFRLTDTELHAHAHLPANPPISAAVAVMNFEPRHVSDAHRAAGDLLADEVVLSLGRTAYLTVISRLSSMAAATRGASLQYVGQWLGATYLVSGSFDCDGSKLVLRVEMIHAPTKAVLWSRRWTTRLADVLNGQDHVVGELVSAISYAIVRRELKRSSHQPLPSLDSHNLLVSSIGHIHRSSAHDFDCARGMLEQLAERHARLPHANAWLGKWHVLRTVQGLSTNPLDDAKRALDRANRALDADPNSAMALAMKGHVHGFLLKNLDVAESLIQSALEIAPNEPLAWIYLATLRAWQGRAEEGLPLAARARQLSPLDPTRYYYDNMAAFIAMTAGDFVTARDLAKRSLQANRLHLASYRTLAIAEWNLGESSAARQAVARMMRIDAGFTVRTYLDRYPAGSTDQARRNAQTLRSCGAPA